MKMKRKKIVPAILCALALSVSLAGPCSLIPGSGHIAPATVQAAAKKNGLKKEKGYYRYYTNGKKLKSCWKVIKGKKYYFKKNGNAAVLSCKIGGTYYVFNEKGQLMQPSLKKIVKIKNKKYYVDSKGRAVKGWSKNKKNYFYETGEMVTGIDAFKEKFYCFSASGTYDKAKTDKLRRAARYTKPLAPVLEIIGKPLKVSYSDSSCFGDGQDGELKYKNFTVFTFKPREGEEIFMGVE